MSDIEYITTRPLANKAGKETGKVRIIKLVTEGEAAVTFKCPECGFEENSKKEWTEPFVVGAGKTQSFVLACGKCGNSVKMLKLKKEVKKKQ